MTGLIGTDEYIEMELICAIDREQTKYYAVVPDTADNMMNAAIICNEYGANINKVEVKYLGRITVQIPKRAF
jgi:hypothetical protein